MAPLRKKSASTAEPAGPMWLKSRFSTYSNVGHVQGFIHSMARKSRLQPLQLGTCDNLSDVKATSPHSPPPHWCMSHIIYLYGGTAYHTYL
jgi:hypothetical protein